MRRSIAALATGFLLLLGTLAAAGGATAATVIAPTTTCSNGIDNTPGLGLICEVTIVNRLTGSGGTATVTVRECHGAAGAPETACATTQDNLTEPVTNVTQCNDAINGGGGTLRCSVKVTNQYVGVDPTTTAATVNQCVGSGGGITTGCDPFPATTTGATITQCNGSANGGTLVELTCTATGTAAAQIVTIDQCNGSANGGGALVICSADITNVRVAAGGGASVSPSATSTATRSPRGGVTVPPTATLAATTAPAGGSSDVVFVGIFGLGFALFIGQRSIRAIAARRAAALVEAHSDQRP